MKNGYSGGIKVLVSGLIIAGVSAAVCDYKFYGAFADSFFAFTVISFVILYLRVCPKWSTALTICSLALVFAAIEFGILRYPARPMVWVSLFGLSAFTALPVHGLWATDEKRKTLFLAFFPVLPFVVLGFFMPFILSWVSNVHPKTLDLYLLSFDYSLRVPFTFLFGQAFARSLFLAFTGWAFYMALPIPIAVVYAGQLVKCREKAFEAITAFLIVGPIALLFYYFFPAAGPHNLFGTGFPFHVFPMSAAPKLLLEPVATAGLRNAMPSVHLACALLAWWYSSKLSLAERAITFVFLVYTVFAVLGTGEHWFVDIVVACPFCIFLRGLCMRGDIASPRRIEAMSIGLGGTVAWLAALRFAPKFFWISPIIPWALALGTIAVTIVQNRKLYTASKVPAAEHSGSTGLGVREGVDSLSTAG
ncbi:MAG TPA: phosphatase PAP2 family protein [Candidatus Acidoferrales bacterium]|nr:phosphatase PAP2 family protein [Candidatus Acidoferrales bacterium]